MKKFRRKYWLIVTAILGLALISAGFLAITNPGISLYHIGAGGQSGGGGFFLTGSIGQHDTSGTLSGGEFTLTGGLWSGGKFINHLVFAPLILK